MRDAVSESAAAHDRPSRGSGFSGWIDPPGQAWRYFIQATDELVMVVEGEIESRFADGIFSPVAAEEALTLAGATHTVRNSGTTESC